MTEVATLISHARSTPLKSLITICTSHNSPCNPLRCRHAQLGDFVSLPPPPHPHFSQVFPTACAHHSLWPRILAHTILWYAPTPLVGPRLAETSCLCITLTTPHDHNHLCTHLKGPTTTFPFTFIYYQSFPTLQ